MPVLQNQKHEIYAQHRAAGNNMTDSARMAGYSSGKYMGQTAYSIEHRPEVKERIAELRPAIEEKVKEEVTREMSKLAVERTVARVKVVSRDDIMNELANVVDEAKELSGAAGFTARLRALELMGKEKGMFVDRSMTITSPLDGLSPDTLLALVGIIEKVEKGEVRIAAPQPVIEAEVVEVEPEGDGPAD
jgi:hypothetical protein